MSTNHPGIFLGPVLGADSVSPRMNNITPRDQLKPIRIGEHLVVVNYNSQLFTLVEVSSGGYIQIQTLLGSYLKLTALLKK